MSKKFSLSMAISILLSSVFSLCNIPIAEEALHQPTSIAHEKQSQHLQTPVLGSEAKNSYQTSLLSNPLSITPSPFRLDVKTTAFDNTNSQKNSSEKLVDSNLLEQKINNIVQNLSPNKQQGVDQAKLALNDKNASVESFALNVLKAFGGLQDLDVLNKFRKAQARPDLVELADEAMQAIRIRDLQQDNHRRSRLLEEMNNDLRGDNVSIKNIALRTLAQMLRDSNDEVFEVNRILSLNQIDSSQGPDSLKEAFNLSGDGRIIEQGGMASVTFKRASEVNTATFTLVNLADPLTAVQEGNVKKDDTGTFRWEWQTSAMTPVGVYQVQFRYPTFSTLLPDTFTFAVTAPDTKVSVKPNKSNKTIPGGKQPRANGTRVINGHQGGGVATTTSNDTYEPNDTPDVAKLISTGGTYTSYISTESDTDYYKVTPASTGALKIDLTVPTNVDYDLYLTDSLGNEIGYSINGQGEAEELYIKVTSGHTYYLEVIGYSKSFDAINPYTLKASSVTTLSDTYEQNDTSATAYTISIGSNYNSYISAMNDVDYFKFTPTSTGNLTIDLTVPTNVDYDLYVEDASGNTYTSSIAGIGITDEVTLRVNSSHTYYVHIVSAYGYDSHTAYNLKIGTLQSSISSDTYEPNDTISTAISATLEQSYTSYVSIVGDEDIYKITPTNSGYLSVQLAATSASVFEIQSLDSTGKVIMTSSTSGGLTEMNVWVNSGKVTYLRVLGEYGSYDDSNPYTVSIGSIQAANDSYEPNDSFDVATSASLGGNFTSYISNTTDQDYYKVTPSSSGLLTVDLTVPGNISYDIQAFDASGNYITSSWYTDTSNNQQLQMRVTSGKTYYFVVSGGGEADITNPYVVKFSTISALTDNYEPNDDMTTATSLATGTSTTSYMSWSGDYDFFKFVPTKTGLMNVTLKMPYVKYYYSDFMDTNGNYIDWGVSYYSDVNNTYSYTVMNMWVTAGQTYYVDVFNFGDAGSSYVLTLGTPVTDTYELNDLNNDATPISVGQSLSSYIANGYDVDKFSVTPTTTGTIPVQLNLPSSQDYDIFVLDQNGHYVGYSNSTALGGTENLSFSANANHNYYIEVVPATSKYFSTTSSYTVTVGAQTSETYEPNDGTSGAYTINFNQGYTSFVSTSTDNDYYSFTSGRTGNDHVTVKVPADMDYNVAVYEDSSSTAISTGTAGVGATEEVDFPVKKGSKYYIKVTGENGNYSTSETYSFMVSELVKRYSFDGDGRVISIVYQNGSHVKTVSFTYDADGNLLSTTKHYSEVL